MSTHAHPGASVPAVLLLLVMCWYVITHSTAEAEAATPAAVKQWITQADQVLEATGTPARALNDSDTALIIAHESGNRPGAVNDSDSNAAAGNSSKGLMQTTATTFRGNALPGHGDIYNPVDNIIAGTRYAISRYGSLDNVPGVRAVHDGGTYIGY